jgi:hypothetical protein
VGVGSDLDDHFGDCGTSGVVLTPKIVTTGVDLIHATGGTPSLIPARASTLVFRSPTSPPVLFDA